MSSIVIAGDTSGIVTLQAPAIAGTTIINLPANSMNIGNGGGGLSGNTAFGSSALNANTTGAENVAIGSSALVLNTIGADNTAVGYRALAANVTGANNTAIGAVALRNNTASNNTAVGIYALYNNTTGTPKIGRAHV